MIEVMTIIFLALIKMMVIFGACLIPVIVILALIPFKTKNKFWNYMFKEVN